MLVWWTARVVRPHTRNSPSVTEFARSPQLGIWQSTGLFCAKEALNRKEGADNTAFLKEEKCVPSEREEPEKAQRKTGRERW